MHVHLFIDAACFPKSMCTLWGCVDKCSVPGVRCSVVGARCSVPGVRCSVLLLAIFDIIAIVTVIAISASIIVIIITAMTHINCSHKTLFGGFFSGIIS